MKGRIVFLGNNVRDEDGQVTLFGDLSSAPVTMEASRMCDAFGLLSGQAIEQADAEQAYIQSPLGGTETYIRLPKELQPDSWKHMRDPVCKLVMSLYGHPDAGGFWQAHCKNALESVGFIEVSESWQSLFYHPELKVMMAVYVDDFKASGPVEALKKAWTLARSKIRTGAPTPIGRYLGCHHNVVELKDRRVIEYDMHDFLEQCVSHYKKVCGEDVDKLPEEDDNEPGKLADAACSVLMKVLYGARLARFDLLKAVAGLASKVTKWSVSFDKRLFRLMCYINDSKGLKMRGYVGRDDKAEDLFLRLFADADFAGCRDTARSTSGVFLGTYGKNTFVPVAAQAKKQSCVSHSTPEAELVAANLALRTQGLPALEVFDKVFGRKVNLFFEEDNNTAISTIKAGYSNTMRHLGRTHRWVPREQKVEADALMNEEFDGFDANKRVMVDFDNLPLKVIPSLMTKLQTMISTQPTVLRHITFNKCTNAKQEDPGSRKEDMLAAGDSLVRGSSMFGAADEKGGVLEEAWRSERRAEKEKPCVAVEFGTFLGYSAIKMARVLGPNARIISFEMDPEVACLALNMIEFAGMSDAIEVWIGQSEDLVCRLARELGPRSVNMVYMDHNQITYHQDFAQLEAMQMLAKDSLLAATQGLKPGAPLLLWRLAEGQKLGRYEFEVVSSPDCGCKQMEDWVVLARFRADNGSQDWSPPEPPREISLLAAECNLM
ncbi:unnamed protein product, partial [Polarella glacialis]